MTAAFLALDDRTLRRADDRRLSIAVGASLVIHALTIAALRGLVPANYAYPQAGARGFAVLQAVIAEPMIAPGPSETTATDPTVEPTLLLPPAANPVETPDRSPPPKAVPLGGDPYPVTGPASPDMSITLGMIEDSATLGPDYVARLAQRFPEPATKMPMLVSSPSIIYPPGALRSGVERRVRVLLTVGADGSLLDSQLLPDDPLFGPTVQETLRSTQFKAAEIDGKPITYWAIVEFVFLLGQPRAPAVAERDLPRRGITYPRQPNVGR